jgi:hypothetical protein
MDYKNCFKYYFIAVPSLFLTIPPPLGLISLAQRKRKKVSVDDEASMYLKNEETIYLQLNDVHTQDESTDESPIYEICEIEDSKDEKVMFLSEYQNYDIESNVTEDLDSYYVGKKECEEVEEQDEKVSASSRFQCITFKDHSTQTDTDHFLENYKQLVDKNESLESELVRWSNRYKTLMTNMKYLESKIQRLTLSSSQAE